MKKYFQKQKEAFRKKSFFGKLSDVLFLFLILAMLIPQARKPLASGVSRLFSLPPFFASSTELKISDAALQWIVLDEQGRRVKLFSSEQPILLNVWATWCPPCIAEMPSFEKLYEKYGEQVRFVFLTNESPEKVEAFLKKRSLNVPVYYQVSNAPEEFSSNSIPVTYLIDKDKKLVLRKKGTAKWNSKYVHRKLDKLISN